MAASTSSKNRRRGATQKQKKRSRRQTKGVVIAMVVAGALALGGWYAWREANRPGASIESMGRAHVPEGMPGPRYNSSPPTSGPHAGATRWGEHSTEIPHINQVHNLEHGGVLVQYNCDDEALRGRCQPVQQALRELVRTAREEIDPKVILAPYARMDQPIALTAWTRVQYLDELDQDAILGFIDGNINRAPEQVQ